MVDEHWVAQLARRELGVPDVTLEPLKGFAGGSSFAIQTGRGRFVLKLEDATAVRAEIWACRTALDVGVPAPAPVSVGVDAGHAFVLLGWIDGEPVRESGPAVAEAGAALRRVHEVDGVGFGWLYDSAVDDGDPPIGPHDSWIDAVRAMAATDELEDVGLLEPGTGDRVVRAIDAMAAPLAAVSTPRLLHGDLHLRHLLTRDSRLIGIIDWGDVAFGDPLFDFGRFRRCGSAAVKELCDGYGLRLRPDQEALTRLYCCVWSVHVLNLELGAGGDWFQPHVAAIERLLHALGAEP